MIPQEIRQGFQFKMTNPPHVLQMFKERGRTLFGKDSVKEMLIETQKHICNCDRCVLVKDERKDGNKSNYIALFLTDAGYLVAIPCYIDNTHINILTLKDVIQDENPNWYIQKYNEIGRPRDINPLKLYFRPSN